MEEDNFDSAQSVPFAIERHKRPWDGKMKKNCRLFIHKISKSFAKRHGEFGKYTHFCFKQTKLESKENLNNAGNFAGTIPES